MSRARASRPVAYERPRDPRLAEWLVRLAIGLPLFAGFFGLGRATAPAPSSEAEPSARVAASAPAAVVPQQLSGAFPLERAFHERAAVERRELAQAAAAARARQQAARRTPVRYAGSASPGAAPSLTQVQASAPVIQQGSVQAPAPAPRHNGSSGSRGSFESSG